MLPVAVNVLADCADAIDTLLVAPRTIREKTKLDFMVGPPELLHSDGYCVSWTAM